MYGAIPPPDLEFMVSVGATPSQLVIGGGRADVVEVDHVVDDLMSLSSKIVK